MQCPLFICPLYDRYDRSSWSTSCKQANAWVMSSASLTWNHDTQQMVALVCTHGRRVFHRCCLHAWDLRCIRNIWLASFSLLLSRDMHAARRSRDIPSFPLLFFKCFSFFPWSVKARLQASCKAHSHEWPGRVARAIKCKFVSVYISFFFMRLDGHFVIQFCGHHCVLPGYIFMTLPSIYFLDINLERNFPCFQIVF